MPVGAFRETQFCWFDENGKAVRYYGIIRGTDIPPGFKVGDKVKLCMHLEHDGFPSPTVNLEAGMFFPLILEDGTVVKETELWTVIQQIEEGE